MSKIFIKKGFFRGLIPLIRNISLIDQGTRIPLDKNDFIGIAKYISKIENDNIKFNETIKNPNSKVITTTITGAPGVGKSTLLNELINLSLSEGKSVAALMLDPRSSISGGSFLGDRIRLNQDYPNKGVFLRSAAFSLYNPNDIAKIKSILNLFKFLGFENVFLETIGTEQNNLNFSDITDVVVSIPNNLDEDWVQILKSDNLDLADIFFINKSDSQSTEAAYKAITLKNQINSGQKYSNRIFQGSAIQKDGVVELYNEIYKSRGDK
jgi:LAO/AO transport system kinase